MGSNLAFRWATGLQTFDDGCADFRSATATVLQQEERDLLKINETGTVHDRAAVPFGGDESARESTDK